MSVELLEPPVRLWACPSCDTQDQTQKYEAHSQMHQCSGLKGFTAPLVEVKQFDSKVDARHLLLSRDDYVGDLGDDARIASCVTERGDGSNDCTVYAPVGMAVLAVPRPGLNREMRDITVSPDVAAAMGSNRQRHTFHDTVLARMARIARRSELQMAFTASAVNAYYLWACGTNAVKPSTDTLKAALFGNSVTPAQSGTAAVTQYAGAGSTWSTGNEASGTGYTAGGVSVSSPSWAQTSNVISLSSAGTPQWTGASFTAYGALVFDTTVSNQGVSWNYFGGAQVVTSGTFTIAWNASGILTVTC